MKDHLPECPANWGVGDMPEGPCLICQMLRACEQRVWKQPLLVVSRRAGWNDALIAAREAVAATFIGWCKDYMNCTDYEHVCGERREIIAAIDALREEKP
jgi:hypothetical protein